MKTEQKQLLSSALMSMIGATDATEADGVNILMSVLTTIAVDIGVDMMDLKAALEVHFLEAVRVSEEIAELDNVSIH